MVRIKNSLALMVLMVFCLMLVAPVVHAGTIVAQPGDNNSVVGELNKMLKDLGYYYGPLTNNYGVSTKNAVMIFQRANGLAATGTVDETTYQALKNKYNSGGNDPVPAPEPQPTPSPQPQPTPEPQPTPDPDPNPGNDIVAKPGDNNATVGEIHKMLKKLGYYYGSPGYYYTTSTKYAVARFQSTNGLKATGTVDKQTYDVLKAKYQGQVPDTDPTPVPVPNPQPTPDPQPNPKPQPNPTPPPVAGLTAQEQQMVNMVNQERAKAGLKPLVVDMRLVQSARVKSQDMIQNNYFSHVSPTYGSFTALIRQYAPDYRYIGENLAGNRTVAAAQSAFMNSTGHRKNILNPNYTHIGIGIVSGGPYGQMFTQHFGGK